MNWGLTSYCCYRMSRLEPDAAKSNAIRPTEDRMEVRRRYASVSLLFYH